MLKELARAPELIGLRRRKCGSVVRITTARSTRRTPTYIPRGSLRSPSCRRDDRAEQRSTVGCAPEWCRSAVTGPVRFQYQVYVEHILVAVVPTCSGSTGDPARAFELVRDLIAQLVGAETAGTSIRDRDADRHLARSARLRPRSDRLPTTETSSASSARSTASHPTSVSPSATRRRLARALRRARTDRSQLADR